MLQLVAATYATPSVKTATNNPRGFIGVLEPAPTEIRHPHQAYRLQRDDARDERRSDTGPHERLQSIRIRAPHQEPEYVGNQQHDRHRRMRFNALRPDATRQLNAITNRPSDRGESGREAAADLPVNRQRSRKQ